MAYISANSQHGTATANGILSKIVAAIGGMVDGVDKYRQYSALADLSDAELANRGLNRENLARFVFLDNTLS